MKKSLKLLIQCLPLLFMVCFAGNTIIKAQSIHWAVVNAYGHIEGDDARMEWTMGEPLTTEVTGSSGTLRVGFFPFTFSDESTTASAELSPEIEISIFPNPASSALWVQSPGTTQKIFRILSLDGKPVLFGDLENETAINIQSLASGPYVVYIIEPSGAYNSKTFIKS